VPNGSAFNSALSQLKLFEGRLRGVSQDSLLFGIEPLDGFLRGFFPGEIAFLYGSPSSYALTDLMIVRALLPCDAEGSDANVIFIDGGNCFNLYRLSELIRQFRLPTKPVLKRIHISRSFTSHQLTTLIVRELSHELAKHPSRLVVVSDLLSIARDEESDEIETKSMLGHALNKVRELAAEGSLIVLLPNSRITVKKELSSLSTFIWPKVDIIIKLQELRNRTRVTREKHPLDKGMIEIDLRLLTFKK
jgi:Rad51 protein